MRAALLLSLLAVTACGSSVVQASAVTCADGGSDEMCAAQQTASPEAGMPVLLVGVPCEGKRDCPAKYECRARLCQPKGGHHDDHDDDDDCDD